MPKFARIGSVDHSGQGVARPLAGRLNVDCCAATPIGALGDCNGACRSGWRAAALFAQALAEAPPVLPAKCFNGLLGNIVWK
ncbi:MAG: hypothetical protein WC803_02275 [Sphingomonas sp.]